jgi:hypothetical protein
VAKGFLSPHAFLHSGARKVACNSSVLLRRLFPRYYPFQQNAQKVQDGLQNHFWGEGMFSSAGFHVRLVSFVQLFSCLAIL